jgi:hypothetical protein
VRLARQPALPGPAAIGYTRAAMERPAHAPAGKRAPAGFGHSHFWSLLLLPLLLWQGWMTLSLFGRDRPWERLLDDEPVLSGRHALHQYHGQLGAQALWAHGRLCCFDPNFQAGYPKTPIFDGGSRPAELFLFLAGGGYRPAAYKAGLAVCWLAVPLLLAAAARNVGLNRAAACAVAAAGLLVWWGAPCRAALEAGHLDLLLASLAALVQAALLVRFDRAPCATTWLGILGSGCLGWFAHPVFFALLLPLALVFYVSVGARHAVPWHLALLAALAGGVAVNAFWLVDGVNSCWIHEPLRWDHRQLAHRTFRTLWEAPLWGEPADRALTVALVLLAVVGAWRLNQSQQRPAARLFGLGAAGFLGLAVGGAVWEPLGTLAPPALLVPALLFAAVPAVYALLDAFRRATRWTGARWRAALVLGGLLLLAAGAGYSHVRALADRCAGSTPLVLGLSPQRTEVVAALCAQTTPEARILWEDRSGPTQAERWTALLPVWTGRAYLGGLDPDAGIEHAQVSFTDQLLRGRPVKGWSDAQLEDFCRRYNVGWVVCWSPAAVARFHAWEGAEAVATLQDQETGCLFRLRRRPLSFVLKGRAQWLEADWRRIAVGDVVPEDGQVVLSLHYQTGMQVSPGSIRIERELDPYDPIPFVRLRLPGPVARLTLMWEGP